MVFALGLALFSLLGSPQAQAQAPSPCDPLLSTAEERYIQREFVEAEALVRACLAQTERTTAEAVQSYRLLALIALRQDNERGAEQAARQLLAALPGYTPDPVQDPPAYVNLITTVDEQLRAEGANPPADSIGVVPPVSQAADAEPEIEIVRIDPDPPEDPIPTAERATRGEGSGITRWLLIGGGVIAAGVAAVLLASGGSSSPPSGGAPLPPPPPFPR